MSIFDDIEEIAEDVVDAVVSGVGDLIDAGEDLFEGPGGLTGIMVAGVSLFVVGPGFAIPAFIAGSVLGNALIKHRPLSADESALATTVFGDRLPGPDEIILTNLQRPDGRKFTCPNPAGQVLINLGDQFDQPLQPSPAYPALGKLLIHELAHAWQIHHSSFVPGLICEGLINGLTGAPYDPGAPNSGRPWDTYNLEQQATIVDEWFAPSTRGPSFPYTQRAEHPFFRYIVEDIRGGSFPHRQVTSGSGRSRSISREAQRLDIFFVGADRAIGSVAWEAGVNNNAWSAGFPVTQSGAVRADSPLAAVSRTPQRLDVFFVGNDGAIGSVAWEAGVNNNAWSDGFPVTKPGAVRQGSPLVAVSRTPHRLDLFFLGSDGAVGSVTWEAGVNNNAWSDGFPVTRPGAVRADSPLAAVTRTPLRVDVFFVGADGAIGSVVWEAAVNNNTWSDGFPVTRPGAARPGSQLAVTSRIPPRSDVFFLGNDGAIGSVAWELAVNNNAWSDGFPVTKPGATRADSPLAALSRTAQRLDVFFVGNDGAIGSVAWDAGVNNDAWSDGFPVTKPGAVRPGSPVAAVSRTPERLDLFFVGNDGAIGSVAWEAGVNNNAWSDGFPVSNPGAATL